MVIIVYRNQSVEPKRCLSLSLSVGQKLTIESNQPFKGWAFRHSRTAVSPNQWSLESTQAVGYSFVQTMRGSFQRLGGREGCSLGQHQLLKVVLCRFGLPPHTRAIQVIETQCFMKTGSVCIWLDTFPLVL